MAYHYGAVELRRSVTRRWAYHWRDGDGDTGYLSAAAFHLLRALRRIRKHPRPRR